MKQHLGIAARLKNGAVADEIVTQLARVHEIAVVRHGDLSVGAVDEERLRVSQAALASGRVPGMANREVAR